MPDPPTNQAAAPLRVMLLGGFRVTLGGFAIPDERWRLRKGRALVKLLALAPGHQMHREQLCDHLWPEMGPADAANNLHHTLHLVRRVLVAPGGSGVSALPYARFQGALLTLAPPGALWVDVNAFEAASEAARTSRDPLAYRAALDLYAGDLLPEDRYEDWAAPRRDALRQRYLALLGELAELYVARGEPDPAGATLERLLAADPAHEAAHRGLMRLYARAGDRQRALRQYDRLREALERELGMEPDPESRRLREEIRDGRLAPAPVAASAPTAAPPERAVPSNTLPTPLTSFIGRERELAELARLLRTTRLLMLAGPGGCGKTRLALAIARDLQAAYPDGVWFVELASLGDPGLVPQAVAAALGVPEQADRPLIETLVAYLRDRRALLVLDNCEHLIVACAYLAEALLQGSPELRLLATSREPLHIGGELVWRVPSLTLPDPRELPALDALAGCEAIRLFVERARAIRTTFALTERNAEAVARLCHRLDGMPLALELAAARVGVLSIEQIVARLDDCIALLTGGSRTSLTRQQTLRAALDWSHALLDERERALLRRLAVFAGGFSLEAAEAVAACGDVAPADVFDLLAQLVDKSLVVADPLADAGEARYHLLEPVRQYARSQLQAAGELVATQRRHWDWCLALAREADAEWRGPTHQRWLARMELEHDNVRAALGWCVREDAAAGLQLAGVTWQFWLLRGYLLEGARWLEDVLAAAPESAPFYGEALLWICALHGRQGGSAVQGMVFAERSLAAFRAQGDGVGSALAAYAVAMMAYLLSDFDRMHDFLAQSLALAQKADYLPGVASIIYAQGFLAWHRGEYAQARALLDTSLARYRSIASDSGLSFPLLSPTFWSVGGNGTEALARLVVGEETLLLWRQVPVPVAIGYLLAAQGTYARFEGDFPRAHACLEEALAVLEARGDRSGTAQVLGQLGALARLEGRYEQAEAYLRTSLVQRREVGERRGIAMALNNLVLVAAAACAFDKAHTLLEEGRALLAEMADRPGLHGVYCSMGYVAACEGNFREARALYDAAIVLHQQIGSRHVPLLASIGIVARLDGDRVAARDQFSDALALARAQGNQRAAAIVLTDLGELALDDGDAATARAHFAESLTLAHQLDDRGTLAAALAGVATLAAGERAERAIRLAGAAAALDPARQAALERALEPAHAAREGERFVAAWAEGQAMDVARAVELALEVCDPGPDAK
jgi:predicted ATPase/DNA-binding SARP family transcriptional activator